MLEFLNVKLMSQVESNFIYFPMIPTHTWQLAHGEKNEKGIFRKAQCPSYGNSYNKQVCPSSV
jgi:hypothetical protein